MWIDLTLIVKILVSAVAALIMSFAATPIVKIFAQKVGAMDVPKDDRRVHDHPIPRLGGLAIFLGFLLSVVLFADINRQIQGILLGAVVIVIVGVIDDITPLKAWIKLIFQIVAALIAVYHGVAVEVVSNPNIFSSNEYLFLNSLSVPITVLWIVAITNAVNLIDGLDGLAVGVSAISSVTMLVIAVVLGQGNIAIILAALAGACIGFMPYNLNPAKIFMGDTGALLLGYVLATLSILGLFKFYAIISFAVPFLVLALPIFDTALAFCRRISKGKSPMSADRGHFHHRLIDMGLSQKQAVAILYAISGILGLSAVIITTEGEIKAMILVLAFCFAGIVALFIMRSVRGDNGGKAASADNALPDPREERELRAADGEMPDAEHTEYTEDGEEPERQDGDGMAVNLDAGISEDGDNA